MGRLFNYVASTLRRLTEQAVDQLKSDRPRARPLLLHIQTENDWLTCTSPDLMLDFLQDKASERKFRLFACRCCQPIFSSITQECCRQVIQIAEAFADGQVTAETLAAAHLTARDAQPQREANFAAAWTGADSAKTAADLTSFRVAEIEIKGRRGERKVENLRLTAYACSKGRHSPDRRRVAHRLFMNALYAGNPEATRLQLSLVHEIFGNPFHPFTLNPAWVSSTVVNLANCIYTERDFGKMPILGDALEDAGCDNPDILNHCRQAGEHCRGCWCLDMILGKDGRP